MFGGAYFAGGYFAGVIKGAAMAAHLAASVTIRISTGGALPLPTPSGTDVAISVGGSDVTGRVRVAGLTIHDILNDAPNTCQFTIAGAAPAVGQRVRVTIEHGARVLFAGAVQTTDQSYDARPQDVSWRCTAIDDTALANARRPFGTWVATSATTIAQAITPSGFSTAGIAAGLPAVSIVCDGSETTIAALARLATAIGGYTKVEDLTVYLFLTDPSAPPDPIDAAHPFLHDPPITINTDASQLRTRVYGKGYGEMIPSDVAAGETILPLVAGALFNAAGGRAIVGTTPDGATSMQITYGGVVLSAGGTLIGPGAAPGAAPLVALASGAGVESGDHDWAYVFVTAAGRSLPSPLARATIGLVPAPTAAPIAGAPGPGGSVPAGTHRYYAVFRTAAGNTTPGPASPAVTVAITAAPTSIGPASAPADYGYADMDKLSAYAWKYTFRRLADGAETTASPTSNSVVTSDDLPPWFINRAKVCIVSLSGGTQAPPAGFDRRWYRTEGNSGTYKACPEVEGDFTSENPTLGRFGDGAADASLGAVEPSVNATANGTVPITNIPVSPSPLVTHVDIYREFNNAGAATARLACSVPNGTTSATDTLATASLGALIPSTNTAAANRATVTWPAGPATVTNIELFRTPLGSAQLKKFHAVGSNTAGTTVDSTPDASLTTNAPASDTSGLTQPAGQVNPGSTTLPVASPAPFRAGGGWVRLPQQVVRYTGVTGSTLTGIPAAGAGAIVTTVLYGQQATPAPALVGVTGLTVAVLQGAAVHLWVQRDDLAAQAAHAARTGGDGIVEYVMVDARRGLASLTAQCDADLARFARPIVTARYATRDVKTKSGKPIPIHLASPAVNVTLTIQDVTIDQIEGAPGLAPRYTVTASSVRFSLEDTLRQLLVRPIALE